MVAFSHLISWVFKKYHNATYHFNGLCFGSCIIWPWKSEVLDPSLTDRAGQPLLIGYSRFFPENWSLNEIVTVACILSEFYDVQLNFIQKTTYEKVGLIGFPFLIHSPKPIFEKFSEENLFTISKPSLKKIEKIKNLVNRKARWLQRTTPHKESILEHLDNIKRC